MKGEIDFNETENNGNCKIIYCNNEIRYCHGKIKISSVICVSISSDDDVRMKNYH